MTALVTIQAVAIGLLGLLVAGLLRSHAEILRALHDLGAGIDPDAEAPHGARPRPHSAGAGPGSTGATATDLVGTTPDGESIALGVVKSAQHTLLAFLSSGCSTCAAFWAAFTDVDGSSVPGGARVVVVTKGSEHESPARVGELAPPEVTVVMSSEAWEAYRVPVVPYFVYVAGVSGRVVGEGSANSWDHVRELMRQALADAGVGDTGPRRRRVPPGDNAARIDADLLSAGIHPGHASLYPGPVVDEETGREA